MHCGEARQLGSLQVETTLINPFNGSSGQQGGLWFGFN